MKKIPLVTVLMPVFNAGRFLKEAIDSILSQSFIDFELLIINDGSSDNSTEIINNYTDPRIITFTQLKNQGLIATLNEGIRLAKGKYIVRMDADDIALPDRLKVQVRFMEMYTDIDACGAFFQLIGKNKIYKSPVSHNLIRAQMLFNSALAHPTMILRKNRFSENNYFFDHNFLHAEDYELWVRSSKQLRFANIPKVLLHYRAHQNQISFQHNSIQRESMNNCRFLQLKALGINPDENQLAFHNSISNLDYKLDKNYAKEVLNWFNIISSANDQSGYFEKEALHLILHKKWMTICGHLLKNKIDLNGLVYKNYFNVNQLIFWKANARYFFKKLLGKFIH